jgi:two-component system, NarL family, response regulator DevR
MPVFASEKRLRSVGETSQRRLQPKVDESVRLGTLHAFMEGGQERQESGRSRSSTTLIRVALLEPDYWRRLGIAAVLGGAGVAIVDENVDLVLLPCGVITQCGMSEIARVRSYYSAEVLVLGDEDSAETAAQVFLAGARGYYTMKSDPAGLCRAVEIVSNGGIWGPPEALALLARGTPADAELEPQQRAVLQLLHDGLTNKEIGQRLGLAEGTIKARMNRLYRRFGVTSRLQLLAAAIRRGFVEIRRE